MLYKCGHDDGIGNIDIGHSTIKITPFYKCKECEKAKELNNANIKLEGEG